MNLEGDLVEYLEKSGFDDFTKIRYIYLYVCNLFSYDVRFMYALPSMKEKIYNKKIDITNVEEFEIVCYTCCRVLVDALKLFNFDAEIKREPGDTFKHTFVVVKYKDKLLKLDPTKKHDLTRVKMNSPTYGFNAESDDFVFFEEKLEEADLTILEKSNNKIDTSVFYDRETIMQLVQTIEDSARKRNLSSTELFFEKIEAMVCLVNTRTDFKRYDDVDFYLSYLMEKFKINEQGIYMTPALFFKKNDQEMKDIINIILIKYRNFPTIFYIMEKVGENYKIRPIESKEVLEKLEEYSNWEIDYHFQTEANKAAGKII